jgi:arsenite methyltransferase
MATVAYLILVRPLKVMVMKVPQFLAKQFLAKQLAHPSGFVGKHVMGRVLNRTTSAHNLLVLDQLAVQPTDRVLEVGFGGAALLEKIVEKAFEGFVAGVELSEAMVANAQLRFRAEITAGCLEIQQGRAESLPYPNAHFNKACTVNTVNFWPDLARCFGELSRVIQPGGQLILGYPSAQAVRDAGLDQRGFLAYSTDELKTGLVAQGFVPGRLLSGSDVRGAFAVLTAERAG